jgi:hypothetical protein
LEIETLDTQIKELRTNLANTNDGKELTKRENELRNIKLELQKLELKEFDMCYIPNLFDVRPDPTEIEYEMPIALAN